MKQVWLSAYMCVVLLAAASALAAAESPMDIVRNTTDQVLGRVQSDRDALRQDPAKMYLLVAELIFPHFDFQIMARWVLGTHWKEADEATRAEFVDQFRKLLVRTYATALLEFSDQAITYPDDSAIVKGRTVEVRQEIEQSGSEPILIGYRLHNTLGNWKVFDVTVDGVSLVRTYRASFASLIRDGGLLGLIDGLSEKNQEISQ
ncbi:MAG TPA: toluene tolerance protein [Gammaproteobacteria bacterium]|nr:toluene tolerance protein [Gammaproteobacteria bacterium]|tara:strand:+ start:1891 stop:2502 length:612 start_codon:yes stop_codon:yes gene_type:complete